MSHLTEVLAQQGPSLNTEGIVGWVLTNVVPLLFVILGVFILAGARKGKMSDNAGTLATALLGIIVIVGAAGFVAFGEGLAGLTFG